MARYNCEPQAHRFIRPIPRKATRPLRRRRARQRGLGFGTTNAASWRPGVPGQHRQARDNAVPSTARFRKQPRAAAARASCIPRLRPVALGEPLDAASALAFGLANAVVALSPTCGAKARAAAEAPTKRPAGSLGGITDMPHRRLSSPYTQMYGSRPRVARIFSSNGCERSCINVPASGWRICSGPSWISVASRAFSLTDRLDRAIWVTMVRTRSED